MGRECPWWEHYKYSIRKEKRGKEIEEDERTNLLPEKSMKKISEFFLSISKSQNQPNRWGEWKEKTIKKRITKEFSSSMSR